MGQPEWAVGGDFVKSSPSSVRAAPALVVRNLGFIREKGGRHFWCVAPFSWVLRTFGGWPLFPLVGGPFLLSWLRRPEFAGGKKRKKVRPAAARLTASLLGQAGPQMATKEATLRRLSKHAFNVAVTPGPHLSQIAGRNPQTTPARRKHPISPLQPIYRKTTPGRLFGNSPISKTPANGAQLETALPILRAMRLAPGQAPNLEKASEVGNWRRGYRIGRD